MIYELKYRYCTLLTFFFDFASFPPSSRTLALFHLHSFSLRFLASLSCFLAFLLSCFLAFSFRFAIVWCTG